MAARDIGVKKYVVKLSEAERSHLQGVVNKGKSPAKRLLKARILKADAGAHGEGWSDGRIVEALDTNMSMVTRVRQQFVEEGLEAVLSRKQRATPAITPIFDGEKEARLMALACSTPVNRLPIGTLAHPNNGVLIPRRYTLHASRRPCALDAAASGGHRAQVARRAVARRLKVVELGIVERASDNTIGRVLKKTRFSLTAKSNGSSRRRRAALS
jgi:hypothetical protein